MNKKDWIYIGTFVSAVVLAVILFSINKNPKTEIITDVEDVTATSTEEGLDGVEVEANAPNEYFDLLSDARDLTRDKKYNEALQKTGEAISLYNGFQAYITISSIHDFTGDIAGKRDALYEVVYTFGNLESKYWRAYLTTLIHSKVDDSMIRSVYEEGITRIESVASTIGMNHLIDMYTGYASYLGGNDFYQEAISYLEKALAIDPERSDIYNSEIESLQEEL
ncbi:MAG: tetratricopeptide (TPR) repeat protein [Candidatus Paceibacteria bacterium]|jgi:tetratricopeptide (TPR) repeat protein